MSSLPEAMIRSIRKLPGAYLKPILNYPLDRECFHYFHSDTGFPITSQRWNRPLHEIITDVNLHHYSFIVEIL